MNLIQRIVTTVCCGVLAGAPLQAETLGDVASLMGSNTLAQSAAPCLVAESGPKPCQRRASAHHTPPRTASGSIVGTAFAQQAGFQKIVGFDRTVGFERVTGFERTSGFERSVGFSSPQLFQP